MVNILALPRHVIMRLVGTAICLCIIHFTWSYMWWLIMAASMIQFISCLFYHSPILVIQGAVHSMVMFSVQLVLYALWLSESPPLYVDVLIKKLFSEL
ncbi:MAG: hypothetical protein VXY77_02140 [Pseudomonadota bacterium]|nr:hypothetical protein [Pseudomonadota bacterium]